MRRCGTLLNVRVCECVCLCACVSVSGGCVSAGSYYCCMHAMPWSVAKCKGWIESTCTFRIVDIFCVRANFKSTQQAENDAVFLRVCNVDMLYTCSFLL